MKNQFNKKMAEEIANKSFAYTLDCVLGSSDPDYDLRDDASTFEQNFEEDLQERGIAITPYKIEMIKKCYDKMVEDFKKFVRKKYYNKK